MGGKQAFGIAVVGVVSVLTANAAQGDVRVVAANLAPVGANGTSGLYSVSADRAGQVAVSYSTTADTFGTSFLIAGPGNATPWQTTLPRGLETFTYSFSNWGLAVNTVYGTGGGIVAAPIGGSFVTLQTGKTDYQTPIVNDTGTTTWATRPTLQTIDDQLYGWSPATGTTAQIPNPTTSSTILYPGLVPVGDDGRVTTVYEDTATAPYSFYLARYTGPIGSAAAAPSPSAAGAAVLNPGWTQSPFVPRASGYTTLGTVNVRGQTLYDSGSALYLLDGTTLTPIASRSIASQYITATLADDGSVLAEVSPPINNPAATYTATVTRPNGTVVNLANLLPPGLVQAASPADGMNFDGQVLVEGQDPATSLYSYFLYDGASLTPLLTEVPKAVDPVLTDTGEMYYFVAGTNGYYSLDVAAVPEPVTAAVAAGAAATTALARRRRRPCRR